MRNRCGLLKNAWYAAAQSSELRRNKPISRIILGEMLVLWRLADGSVATLLDRCPHRNALLSEGTCNGTTIACPYHGWTFDTRGNCVRIPSESEDGTTRRQRSTEAFPVQESDGLVWVWMGGDVAPDRPPFAMPFRGVEGWRTYYMATRFENDVTNLVENFMDVPHTVFVHRGWFRERRGIPVRTTVERRTEEVLVTYHLDDDSIGFTDRLFNPKGLPMVHTDHFFMPNTTRVDYIYGEAERGFVITSTCTPIDDSHTQVYTLISYKYGALGRLAPFFLPWYTRKVIEQDVDIMAIQRRALNHYGQADFSSTAADALHVFIESLREWAESGGEGARPKPMTREMTFWI